MSFDTHEIMSVLARS